MSLLPGVVVVDRRCVVVEPLDGTCDCSGFRLWLFEPEFEVLSLDIPLDEPGDIDGEAPDDPGEDDWANAVPAISRAAAVVTISVRM